MLVLNDMIGNIRRISDQAAIAGQLRRWAELSSLKRILVAHGAVTDNDPPGAVRKLAGWLE